MSKASYELYAITIDIDWAPDFMIEEMASVLTEHGVKCTWFVTHDSPALQKLRANPLFELGIHPNFFPHSSHGQNEDEIIRYCFDLVPEAKSVRTHALYQNSRLISKLSNEYNLMVDCSLFLADTPHLIPHVLHTNRTGKKLVRIPFFWEDDVECMNPNPRWSVSHEIYRIPGMKMFNFHPMYVGLNENDFMRYEALKRQYNGVKVLSELSREEVAPFVNREAGAGTFFRELIPFLSQSGHKTFTASEIAETFLG